MRIKMDMTPLWWVIEAKNPETFAHWCVLAVRLILSVWPRAEIRLSREKLIAAVSFEGDERAGQVQKDKTKVRVMLATIVGMEDMQPEEKVSDRSDTCRSASPAVWDAINKYVRICGGDTGPMTIGPPRMGAVEEVEKAIANDRESPPDSVTYGQDERANPSPLVCQHANENPNACPCPSYCYCNQPGNTCNP